MKRIICKNMYRNELFSFEDMILQEFSNADKFEEVDE